MVTPPRTLEASSATYSISPKASCLLLPTQPCSREQDPLLLCDLDVSPGLGPTRQLFLALHSKEDTTEQPCSYGKGLDMGGLVLKRLLLREMLPSHSHTPSSVPSHHLTRGPRLRRKSSCRAWPRSCCLFLPVPV